LINTYGMPVCVFVTCRILSFYITRMLTYGQAISTRIYINYVLATIKGIDYFCLGLQ